MNQTCPQGLTVWLALPWPGQSLHSLEVLSQSLQCSHRRHLVCRWRCRSSSRSCLLLPPWPLSTPRPMITPEPPLEPSFTVWLDSLWGLSPCTGKPQNPTVMHDDGAWGAYEVLDSFIGKETKTQRRAATCPGSHSIMVPGSARTLRPCALERNNSCLGPHFTPRHNKRMAEDAGKSPFYPWIKGLKIQGWGRVSGWGRV